MPTDSSSANKSTSYPTPKRSLRRGVTSWCPSPQYTSAKRRPRMQTTTMGILLLPFLSLRVGGFYDILHGHL